VDTGDLELAHRFRSALEGAAKTGDWSAVYPYLAADVEWVTPKRTLTGIDEVEHDVIWGTPPEHLDLEFQAGEWIDLGEGRTCLDVLQIYRVKGSGDFAYQRELRVEITIREGKIGRYEIRTIG
jgi:hypothetical protein